MGHKPRSRVDKQTEIQTIEIDGVKFDKNALVAEVEDALEKLLRDRLDEGSDFASYEKGLMEIAREVVRQKLEKKLQAIADSFVERLWIDHDNPAWLWEQEGTKFQYRRHAPGTVTYHSLAGPLRVQRDTYRQCNRLRGVCVPLELEAGLIERMTPAMAKSLAIGYSYMPTRQYEEFLVTSGLQPPSRSTLDRLARDLGGYAATVHDDVEPLVRANESVDARARSIAVGLDRTAVPMRHGESPLDARLDEREMRRTRPAPRKRDRIRGPVQWRMDYVGTVSLLDEAGKEVVTRKYRLPADGEPQTIVTRMIADVRRALEQRPLSVVVVQDGAPELWTLMTHALRQEPLVSEWTEVLDWYHLDERLSSCLDLCSDARTRAAQRKRWHDRLLGTDDGVEQVVRSLRCKRKQLEADKAAALDVHINYLMRNKHRTRYATCKKRLLPIGSGITEGACKSVVGVRAKRSGQRWSQRGLTAALHLRSIHQSDRFELFWSFFRRYYRARSIVHTWGARA